MNKNDIFFSVFALVALVLFSGCGESSVSKLEEAKIALDNKDFSKAIALTEELLDVNGDGVFNDQDNLTANDAEAAHLSTSARFGRAGIDLTGMLDLAEKNTGTTKPSSFASSEKTVLCIADADFKKISDLIPVILVQQHLTDLDIGIKIVDTVISRGLISNLDKRKQENLLKAIGNAARIVVAIIVATDTNRDNKPDSVPSGTALTALAEKVEASFVHTLSGLADSGIVSNSKLLAAINILKNNITTGSGSTIVTGSNLDPYLKALVNQCLI